MRPTSDIEGLRSDPDIEFLVDDRRDETSPARLLDHADALVHVAGIRTAVWVSAVWSS